MRKKMVILALTIALCGAFPLAAYSLSSVPQAVDFHAELFSGSISFAGENHTLVGDLPNVGMMVDYWVMFDPHFYGQPVRFYEVSEGLGAVNITFETGPRIGTVPGGFSTDYFFDSGGFIKIDYVSPSAYPVLSGFFEDARVDGEGLTAHIRCDFITHNYVGGGTGLLQIDFSGAGVAPDPFTITNFQELRLFTAPVPGTVVLLGSGLLGLVGLRRFRKS
ncbi:MAG: PEP-CTERM sorting domain-containing protein [Desulfobaccales bacterium]